MKKKSERLHGPSVTGRMKDANHILIFTAQNGSPPRPETRAFVTVWVMFIQSHKSRLGGLLTLWLAAFLVLIGCDTIQCSVLRCSDPLSNQSLAFFVVLDCHLHTSPAVQSSRWPLMFAVGAFIVRVPFHLKGQLAIMNVLQASVVRMTKFLGNPLYIVPSN